MTKYLLLIDDKEEFKNTFLVEAQNRGYQIAWGRSQEDLESKVPKLHRKITAVILDVKCLLKNNQEIENNKFIGSALTFLNKNYKDLPRVILTGDKDGFTSASDIFSGTEDIYKKDPDGFEALFLKIDEFHEEFPKRLMTLDEKELLELIESNEGRNLEFKAALQYNFHLEKKDKSGHFNILKSIAAFSNSEGGTLLIGVRDDKSICGLEEGDYITLKDDNKEDLYKLLLDEIIQEAFGNHFHSNLENIKFFKIQGKTVCKITIKGKHSSPVYIKKKADGGISREAFYIRGQASTRELKDNEQIEYVKGSWTVVN